MREQRGHGNSGSGSKGVQGMREVRLIAGSGRSGTTWVLDAVAHANTLRPVFEPLNRVQQAVPDFAYRYLPPDAEAPELLAFMRAVFEGNFGSLWSDYRALPELYYPSREFLTSTREFAGFLRRWRNLCGRAFRYRPVLSRETVIVKEIRANLMLGWIASHFNARIALLIRHPCAVVDSQLRHVDRYAKYWEPHARLAAYRSEAMLLDRLASRYRKLLDRDLSPVEACVLVWCIENQLPMEEAGRFGYGVISYEALTERSNREWLRLQEHLDLACLPRPETLEQPSQQASAQWKSDPKPRDSWMRRLSPRDLGEIDAILNELEVGIYNVKEPLPVVPS